MFLKAYSKFLFLLLIVCLTTSAFAQTISNKLLVVNTDYEIYYNDLKLEIAGQGISERGVCNREERGGWGYQSYHLEFYYNGALEIDDDFNNVAEFFNAQGDLLTSINIGYSDHWDNYNFRKKAAENKTQKKHYSINLVDVPLFLLDDVRKVVIRED